MSVYIPFTLLMVALAAAAEPEPDLFQPPPEALQNSKYANDCGGEFPDLEKDMPPVEYQKQAPWCATYSEKALLDYQFHVANKNDHYQNRLSASDLNSWDSRRTESLRGRLPSPFDSSSPQILLQGAQDSGMVYQEKDYPVDQALFDPNGVLAKLSSYYDTEKYFAADSATLEFRDKSPPFQDLERQFGDLLTLIGGVSDRQSFLTVVAAKHGLGFTPRAGAKRVPVRPFNYRDFAATTGDDFMEELQRNLKDKRPMIAGVCGSQLLQIPGLGRYDSWGDTLPPTEKNACGAHALVVIGMQKVDGECRVHIRNSWGTDWPAPAGGGNGWISVKKLLSILAIESDHSASLYSISERNTKDPIANQLVMPQSSYTGATAARGGEIQFNGSGTLTKKNGDIFSGTFSAGKGFISGTLTLKNGTIASGTFDKNGFIEGTFSGEVDGGSTYVGEWKDHEPQGKGRLVAADGTLSEGEFKDGKLINGTFKGLIDRWNGVYYEGPIVDGMTAPEGKFTDKDDHPAGH